MMAITWRRAPSVLDLAAPNHLHLVLADHCTPYAWLMRPGRGHQQSEETRNRVGHPRYEKATHVSRSARGVASSEPVSVPWEGRHDAWLGKNSTLST